MVLVLPEPHCCSLWLDSVDGKTLWTEETLSPLLLLYALKPSVDACDW